MGTKQITYVFCWSDYVADYTTRMIYMALEARRFMERDCGLQLEPMR